MGPCPQARPGSSQALRLPSRGMPDLPVPEDLAFLETGDEAPASFLAELEDTVPSNTNTAIELDASVAEPHEATVTALDGSPLTDPIEPIVIDPGGHLPVDS